MALAASKRKRERPKEQKIKDRFSQAERDKKWRDRKATREDAKKQKFIEEAAKRKKRKEDEASGSSAR